MSEVWKPFEETRRGNMVVAEVRLADVAVHARLGRRLNVPAARKLVREFDDELAGMLEFAEVDGVLYHLDSRNRVAALRKRGVEVYWGLVHEGLTEARFADLMLGRHGARSRVAATGMEEFRYGLLGTAESTAKAVARAAKKHGFVVPEYPGVERTTAVRCHRALLAACEQYGEDALAAAFAAVEDVFMQTELHPQVGAVTGEFLTALAWFAAEAKAKRTTVAARFRAAGLTASAAVAEAKTRARAAGEGVNRRPLTRRLREVFGDAYNGKTWAKGVAA